MTWSVKRTADCFETGGQPLPRVPEGEYRGFVELALEIPFDMPHFVRGE